VALALLTVRLTRRHREPTMHVTARRTLTSRARSPRPEREPSDMATEMLVRIIYGLSTCCTLGVLEQQLLFHFLFGRSAAATAQRLGVREATVEKHLQRIYATTKTDSRRALLHLGLSLAKQLERGSSGSTPARAA
jgi:DNA-binding CsgD family transcriptional regulator